MFYLLGLISAFLFSNLSPNISAALSAADFDFQASKSIIGSEMASDGGIFLDVEFNKVCLLEKLLNSSTFDVSF